VSVISSLYRWIVGALYTVMLCVVVVVLSLVLPARSYDPVFKALMRGLFKVLFIRVEVRGAQRVRAGTPSLFMANHVSIFDPPLLGGFLPGMVRGIEWAPHFRVPLYGMLIRRVGNIPIDRDSTFASLGSMRQAQGRLAEGESLVILPEAHRTTDGSLRHFKRLPFLLARQAGVDLVPVGLSGLFGLHRKGSWRIRHSRLTLSIGEVIPADQVASLSVDELWRITRQRIESLIERP
jgi:1-acyl-sn-glycerol-3-phosphate acyltransferase